MENSEQNKTDKVDSDVEFTFQSLSPTESVASELSEKTTTKKQKKKLSFKNIRSNVINQKFMPKRFKSTEQITSSASTSLASSETTLVVSDPESKPEEKQKRTRKTTRAASFVKKLTAATQKKTKVAPKTTDEPETPELTPSSLKRETPEGSNLSVSEISLIEIEETSEPPPAVIVATQDENETNEENVSKPTSNSNNKASSGIQLPSQSPNTINKSEGGDNKNGAIANNGISIGDIISSIILDEKEKSNRFTVQLENKPISLSRSVTEETAPSLSNKFSVTQVPDLPEETSKSEVKEIIVDDDKAAETDKESFMNKKQKKSKQAKASSPSPTVHVQEAREPYQLGNNLKNPELSAFKATDPPQSLESSDPDPEPRDEIVFNIGTEVRPRRTSAISQIRDILSVDSAGNNTNISSPQSNDDFSSIEPRNSVVEDLSGVSEVSRRRIAYVAQPTLLTPEEEELLVQKQQQLLSHMSEVSGISDYTLESGDYLESKMTPHGDLMVEKNVSLPNMSAVTAEKREHLYKILVIGELGTGKTSFIKRYVHQFFSQNYRATIGVDFALKVLNWDQNTIIRLQLWDIAGQERFGNMTRVYYKEAVGAFIVFDVTRSATFDAVIKWKQDLDSKVQLPDGKPIPCILLANKCDQQKQGIVTTPAKLDEYVKEHGFAGWYETSAKENVNIEEAAKALVNKILLNDKLINSGELIDSERFGLDGDGGDGSKKSCAC